MTQINIYDFWNKEWENASKFFQSKGNIKTKSRLKDKWFKDFKEMLEGVERLTRELTKENTPSNEKTEEKK